MRIALPLKVIQDSLAEVIDEFEGVKTDLSDRNELVQQMRKKITLYHRACELAIPAIYLTDSSLRGLERLPKQIKQRDSIQYTLKYHQINLAIYRAQLALKPMYDSMLWGLEQESRFLQGSDSSRHYLRRVVSTIEQYAKYRKDEQIAGEAMLELTGTSNREELNELDEQHQEIERAEKRKIKQSKP